MSACQGESKDIVLNASSTLVRNQVCFIPVYLVSVHLYMLVSRELIPLFMTYSGS